ncbi:MAG: hypothetical protein HY056_13165 [Proteobacteria bacterium]|nr:hypothetical protein [Pseudomonadota bacterium]
MREFAVVSDADIERARRDRDFRRDLVSVHLDILLAALNRLRAKSGAGANEQALISDGAQLAVRLADILHALASGKADKPAT